MLDENCENALKTIINSCAGGYTVLDAGDFSNVTDVEKTLALLSAGGYVSLRYSGSDEYLLMPTEKGANYFYGKTDRLIYRSVLRRNSALYSFLGAAVGGAFAVFIALLILAIGGALA